MRASAFCLFPLVTPATLLSIALPFISSQAFLKAAEVIDTVICGGDFLRFVNLINDKKEKKPTIDIDWSDICDKKLSDIFDMDIEQRTTILNMLFPMNRFNACELRELEIEKYIDSIAKRLKEKYLNLVKSADELMG